MKSWDRGKRAPICCPELRRVASGRGPIGSRRRASETGSRFRNPSLSASLHLQRLHSLETTAWGLFFALDLGLGTGDWRFGIDSRGQWRRATRSQPRPGGRRVANHRARGQRQPAALRRIRRTKATKKLDQQANESEPQPRRFGDGAVQVT
ncbi:hypothetical protein BBK36DRAFT_2459 [Trichoderma citrinoviride]|uniref:Uncharacterized protein n=1 Tax=Trichoderma citrinoviride TaxID=58853 RepID=A0A2T4BIH8_9HYPO|nr:hypothetical protein BBK36DRAFT_2459 [Trichoderma citrinoviride]PTB69088.1 hypothetical protein BBK36DRAFT_2459 [Trichoderma citrinoviride]